MLDSWVWGEVGMLGGWAVGQSFKVDPKYTCLEDIEGICQGIEDITKKHIGEYRLRSEEWSRAYLMSRSKVVQGRTRRSGH
jgi:hypothetical protein